MDKIRIALLGVLFLIGFMLITEYAQFRQDKSRENILTQENSFETDTTLINDNNQTATVNTESDVPVIADNNDIQIPSVLTPTTLLINVNTDKFSLKINPNGGDIVELALNEHYAHIDTPNIPFALLEENKRRSYIAKSGLIGTNGTDTSKGRPLFATSQNTYRLNDGEDTLQVDLQLDQNGNRITKRFIFNRDSYLINVEYIIDNKSDSPFSAAFYGQIIRDNSQDPAADSASGMGMQPYLGFATTTADERFKKIDFDDVKEKSFAGTSIEGGWIAMIQHYYLSAWIGDQSANNNYSTRVNRSGYNIAQVTGPVISVAAGTQGIINNAFYAGPKDQYELESIAENLDLSVDYGWLWFIAQPLYALLYFFNNGEFHAFGIDKEIFSGLGNWGFSIIVLTILVKALFFSLNAKAYRSMAKMRAIQPKMLEMREKFGDDKQKQSQEMMKLYKTEGVNPIGGCLPMLVQMPVFIALYWVLLESVELRHAPFIGYIQDLSAMDPYFIMPLIMGASMFIQQKLNPPPPDPMQAKIMQFLPVIFTFFFLFFPAGLVLYWVVNNILSIAQQWVITKHIIGEAEKK
jgi:YidC/Oxa1 family membrane protein insertase